MKKIYLTGAILLTLAFIGLGIYFIIQTMENNKQSEKDNQNNEEQKTQEQIKTFAIEVLKEGSGEAAKAGDAVSVHYVGTLQNGVKFDSSRDREAPFLFTLGEGRVIQGWDMGVEGMKIGEKRKLIIPSNLAYGPNDYGPIPGGSTLIFEIELLSINQ
jgi:FKBP-type peptidyl-prolyl cis-trans isomerase